jgi:D-amino-acid dehydrogenase
MQEERFDCDWSETGLLYVLQTEHGVSEFAATDRLLREEFGVAATRIDPTHLADFDPSLKPGLAGGFHYPGDASLRPDLLNKHWSQRLRDRGVTFRENCTLQTLQKSAGKISRLQTSQGDLTADAYVFATGAWSTQLAKQLDTRIPIEPGKGYSVTMRRPDPCPSYPMLFPEHRVGVSPFASGYRLGSIMEFAGYDTSIAPARIQQLRDSAAHYLHQPYTDDPGETWYGWRPMTWDSLPIIGRAPKLANAYLATGHNMLGMSLATATGRLIAEMLTGDKPHLDVSAYSPARFGA